MDTRFMSHGQKNQHIRFKKRVCVPAGLYVLFIVVCLYAAMPVLSRLEMIGSGRGGAKARRKRKETRKKYGD